MLEKKLFRIALTLGTNSPEYLEVKIMINELENKIIKGELYGQYKQRTR